MTDMSNISKNKRENANQPNPVDIYVGNRLRQRRMLMGLSQKQMANELGVTFQQVQKYENGVNRISASRLWDISKILKAPIDFFFDGMDEEIRNQSPMMLHNGNLSASNYKADLLNDPMMKPEAIKLVKAYASIDDKKISHQLLDLMVALSAGNH